MPSGNRYDGPLSSFHDTEDKKRKKKEVKEGLLGEAEEAMRVFKNFLIQNIVKWVSVIK